MKNPILSGPLVALSCCLVVDNVHALEDSPHAEAFQVAVGPRFGTGDELQFAAGARAGYTLSGNIYLGGAFDFFFGSTRSVSLGGADGEVSPQAWTLAVEGGYDLGIGEAIVVRPFAGIGSTSVSTESCYDSGPLEGCNTVGDSELSFSLGALLNYAMGPIFLGPEVRASFGDGTALVGGAHLGMAF